MLHEHALVVDDVEVVHPGLEAEVDVFAARDLVLLAPRAEPAHDVGGHHVDDRGGRRGEGREHLDVDTRFGATFTGLRAAVTAGTTIAAFG